MTKRPLLVPPGATQSGGIFFVGTMVPAVVCAALEMARVHGGIVTDYGADLFGTAWVYAILRLRATRAFPRHSLASPSSVATVTMIGGIASEAAQRAKLLAGTYDPLDIATFALALLACLVIERIAGPFAMRRDASPRLPDPRWRSSC